VNASPLILLAKIGQFELLRVGEFEVRVPDAVIIEIEAKGIHDSAAVAGRSTASFPVVGTPMIPGRVASWSPQAQRGAIRRRLAR
jgi:hypothetical protein